MKLLIYLYNKSDDFMNVKLRHFQVKNNVVGNTGGNLSLYSKKPQTYSKFQKVFLLSFSWESYKPDR